MIAYTALALVTFVSPASAFIGYGIPMYHPTCATACRGVISGAPLNCSMDHGGGGGGHDHGGGHVMTTAECRATDVPFLTTLAYCIDEMCGVDIPVWEREKYWNEKTTGDTSVPASLSYGEALALAHNSMGDTKPPLLDHHGTLNDTASVDRETWQLIKASYEHFEYGEIMHVTASIVVAVVGFALPIVVTLVLYLPFASSFADKIRPYLFPSTVFGYHVQPLPRLLGNPPTIGQAVYIFLFVAVNIILAATKYKVLVDHTFFTSTKQQLTALIGNRTGMIAFGLAPLLVLFAGRNNFLLWATNWSHSTFLLLHRWVGRLFTLHAIVHSVCELAVSLERKSYPEDLVTLWWIWGAVGTVAASVMVVVSVLYFRRIAYEVFLVLHILLAAFVIIASWYHVEYLYERKWGVEFWMYAVCALWFLDRLLRVLRVYKTGSKRGRVTDLGTDIVRIDIDGVKWANDGKLKGVHAYVYFPSLSGWRIWENHPFSVVPTAILAPAAPLDSRERSDAEKGDNSSRSSLATPASGISLFIRKSMGLTKHLRQDIANALTLSVWLEGPYSDRSTESVLRSDRIVLIAGGIGITGILPFATASLPNTKLYWSVKKSCEALIGDLSPAIKSRVAESEVKSGTRFNLEDVLAREAADGWSRIGVVVCGPGSMCDEVRRVANKRKMW